MMNDTSLSDEILTTTVNALWRMPDFVPSALMKFGKTAIPTLVSALSADKPAKRVAAVNMLHQLGWQPEIEAERVAYAIATENWGAAKDDRTVSYLSARLTEPNPHVRWEATTVLKKIGYEPKDNDERAHYYAATSDWQQLRTLGRGALKVLLQMIEWEGVDKFDLGQALEAAGWDPKDTHQRLWLLLSTHRFSEAADLGSISLDPLVELSSELVHTSSRGLLVEIAKALSRFREKKAVDALALLTERTTPTLEYDDPVFSSAVESLSQIGGNLGAAAIWRSLQKCAHARSVNALERILTEKPSTLADEDLRAIARTEWLTAKYIKPTGPIPFGDPDTTEIVAERPIQVTTLSQLAKAELARRT
ncbi:MAG: hypothetical protein AB1898_32555 [Acidobacteriota bacterium]